MIKLRLFFIANLFLVGTVATSAQQLVLTYDQFPNVVETTGSFNSSASNILIITIDNIPENNPASSFRSNIRVIVPGSNGEGAGKVAQTVLNLDTTGGEVPTSLYSTVTTTGTMTGTLKREFTITALPSNSSGGGSGAYVIGDSYTLRTRLLEPSLPANDVDATSNFEAIEDSTLSTNDINKNDVASNIYTNPVTGNLEVNVDGAESYQVYNIGGQLILSQPATGSINLSGTSTGIYFLVTEAGSAKFYVQ